MTKLKRLRRWSRAVVFGILPRTFEKLFDDTLLFLHIFRVQLLDFYRNYFRFWREDSKTEVRMRGHFDGADLVGGVARTPIERKLVRQEAFRLLIKRWLDGLPENPRVLLAILLIEGVKASFWAFLKSPIRLVMWLSKGLWGDFKGAIYAFFSLRIFRALKWFTFRFVFKFLWNLVFSPFRYVLLRFVPSFYHWGLGALKMVFLVIPIYCYRIVKRVFLRLWMPFELVGLVVIRLILDFLIKPILWLLWLPFRLVFFLISLVLRSVVVLIYLFLTFLLAHLLSLIPQNTFKFSLKGYWLWFYRLAVRWFYVVINTRSIFLLKRAHARLSVPYKPKVTPLRRFSIAVSDFFFLLGDYQASKLFWVFTKACLEFPSFLALKLKHWGVFNTDFYHRVFWRQILVGMEEFRLINHRNVLRWTNLFDDFSRPTLFNQRTAISFTDSYKQIFDESWKEWTFEEWDDEFTDDLRESIWARRLLNRKKVGYLLLLSEKALRLRGASTVFFEKVAYAFATFLRGGFLMYDIFLTFVHFLCALPRLVYEVVVFFVFYPYYRVVSALNVLLINIYSFSVIFRYLVGLFMAGIILVGFMEIFFWFGPAILYVQQWFTLILDPILYYWIIGVVFSTVILSFFFTFFSSIWRESRYFLLIYPMVVYYWYIYAISEMWEDVAPNINFATERNLFWSKDLLKLPLAYFYVIHNTYVRDQFMGTSQIRPGSDFVSAELHALIYESVTSLF